VKEWKIGAQKNERGKKERNAAKKEIKRRKMEEVQIHERKKKENGKRKIDEVIEINMEFRSEPIMHTFCCIDFYSRTDLTLRAHLTWLSHKPTFFTFREIS
jgi:hypothetical protein